MSCPSCSEAHHCAVQLKVTTSGRSPVVPVVQVNEVNVSAASEAVQCHAVHAEASDIAPGLPASVLRGT